MKVKVSFEGYSDYCIVEYESGNYTTAGIHAKKLFKMVQNGNGLKKMTFMILQVIISNRK